MIGVASEWLPWRVELEQASCELDTVTPVDRRAALRAEAWERARHATADLPSALRSVARDVMAGRLS